MNCTVSHLELLTRSTAQTTKLLVPAALGVPVSVPFKLRCMPIGGKPPAVPSSNVYGGVPPEGFVDVEPQRSLPEIGGRQNEYPEFAWPAEMPPRFGVVNASPPDAGGDAAFAGAVGVTVPPPHEIVRTSGADQNNATTTLLTVLMILQCFCSAERAIYSTSEEH
jgi:hypothetical protein